MLMVWNLLKFDEAPESVTTAPDPRVKIFGAAAGKFSVPVAIHVPAVRVDVVA